MNGLELELTVIQAVIDSDKERTILVQFGKFLKRPSYLVMVSKLLDLFTKSNLIIKKESLSYGTNGTQGAVAQKILNSTMKRSEMMLK